MSFSPISILQLDVFPADLVALGDLFIKCNIIVITSVVVIVEGTTYCAEKNERVSCA